VAGIRCVGAAVFDHGGRVIGGVSISVLALEVATPLDGYAAAVQAAARDISASFGAPGVG
jgi:IclR family acetate operon transcriptional repressor